jgi:hypothetical protein
VEEEIPVAAVAELRQFDEIAVTELYPHLAAPVHFHPWLGNQVVQAEADIIAGGTLVDVKRNRGTKTSAGYRWLPPVEDIYQTSSTRC